MSNAGAACLIGTVARPLSTRDEEHAELACKRSLQLSTSWPTLILSAEKETVDVGMSRWQYSACISVVTVRMPIHTVKDLLAFLGTNVKTRSRESVRLAD